MTSDYVIRAQGLSKCYPLYDRPADRLKQMLMRGRRRYYREFWALRETSFEVAKGEVLGLVGRNGAGKSTLLQLVCGVLTPTGGSLEVNGRVAALLELGTGFNPEFSGRENVYLAASILGLGKAEVDERFEEIVDFSGISDFIDQPVKTYSSGMFVRLAFSVATSVDPDILVIDEALSVGDGEFARKSFERIMGMKEAGKTILFCSHSPFQIEAICSRAIWLDQGQVAMTGSPAEVMSAYTAFLDRRSADGAASYLSTANSLAQATSSGGEQAAAPQGGARIVKANVYIDGEPAGERPVMHGRSEVSIEVEFVSDPALPPPHVAVAFVSSDAKMLASNGTWVDGVSVRRNAAGQARVTAHYPKFPMLKGRYGVSAFLFCERGIHMYDAADRFLSLEVVQQHIEQGVVSLPHHWSGEVE